MTIQTEEITDWEDPLFGKYIHTVIEDGKVVRVYSSVDKIPAEMNPHVQQAIDNYLNLLNLEP